MKLRFITLSCLLLSSPFALAKDWVVQAGETYTVASNEKVIELDQLILEDGARLVLNTDVETLLIRAEQVQIGNDVQILGSGLDGKKGRTETAHLAEAKGCKKPLNGLVGGAGQQGQKGLQLDLDFGIVSFGNLSVDVSGGSGGDGGNGTDGQKADSSSSCDIRRGGHAGAPGQGGLGADGGDVTITYRDYRAAGVAAKAKLNTKVQSAGGLSGKSGEPGSPGKGSPGRYINKKSLSGSRTWSSGGKPGKSALIREPEHTPAQDGRVQFSLVSLLQAAQPEPSNRKETPSTASYEQRILLLEKQLNQLQKRVGELEKGR